MKSRIRTRIRIEVKRPIRIRIKVTDPDRIKVMRIHIKVMRIRNPARIYDYICDDEV